MQWGAVGRQVGAGAGKGGASLHPPSPAQCYCDTRPGSQDTQATPGSQRGSASLDIGNLNIELELITNSYFVDTLRYAMLC